MKRVIVLISVCLIALSSTAQISFGPKVGINISKYGQNYKESYNEPQMKFKFGGSIGGMLNLQINDFLAFQPSLMYSKKGSSHDVSSWSSGQYVVTGYDRVRISYFEIPLNLAAGIRLGTGQIQVFAGPYIAFAFAGKNRWDYEENDNGDRTTFKDSREVKFTNSVTEAEYDSEDDVLYQRPFDFGIDFGLGYRYNQLLFNIGFAMGLSSLQPDLPVQDYDAKDYKYSNRTIFITAAWLFGGE